MPCLTTRTPQAAASSAAAVETLNAPVPVPPVPQVSMMSLDVAEVDFDGVRPHRRRRGRELGWRDPLGLQRDEQPAGLRGVGVAGEQGAEEFAGLGVVEVAAFE